MTGRVRRPEIGDRIKHVEPRWDRETEGVVDNLLSAQFVYILDNGQRHFCLYKEEWAYVND